MKLQLIKPINVSQLSQNKNQNQSTFKQNFGMHFKDPAAIPANGGNYMMENVLGLKYIKDIDWGEHKEDITKILESLASRAFPSRTELDMLLKLKNQPGSKDKLLSDVRQFVDKENSTEGVSNESLNKAYEIYNSAIKQINELFFGTNK